ncbi:MAG: protease complex subunit PrcB family protein [Dethiobacteria bacterium]|jgi:hypothetical protein
MSRNVKRFCTVLLIFLTALFIGGCGLSNNPADSEPPEEQQEALPEYEIIADADRLPVEVKSIVENLKSRRGYFVFTPQEYATGEDIYLFISTGAKPTGGYTLMVDSCTVAGDTLGIVVEEKEPAADEGVIQVITFPHLVLKISNSYQSYRIMNDKNESFAAIPAGAVPEITEKRGVYVGQIDNNFIEIEVEGQAQAFMFGPELSPLIAEVLKTGDEILFSYYENNHGQLIITALKTE